MISAESRQELALALEGGARTDYEIPTKWVWAPVASYITWVTIPIISYFYGGQLGTQLAIPLGILGLAGFIFASFSSYLVYLLVNRRNMHFAREETLLWTAFDKARARTQQTNMKAQLALGSTEHDLARLSETVKEHSAVLWALLTLVPYIGWISMTYVLALLTHDIKQHEQIEDLVFEDLSRVTQTLPQKTRRVPRRPVILFVLAGLATLGVFLLPWFYLSIKDPNAHFEYHRSVEPVLVPELSLAGSAGEGN